ncbi:MAG: glycoside hydrolase family 2 protein [Oscillospiraceae bacterium]|nr:glycoside hydrolase family 2 protein [Oscillospiraceae bacterium]
MSKNFPRQYLNNDWQFTRSYSDALHTKVADTTAMETVRLPHTTVETPFHYFDEGIYQYNSAYRRILKAEESWRGKCVLLTVEAAGHESEVFVNGVSVYTHRCGYTAYTVDLAQQLRFGEENVLVIRVDSRETLDQPPFGFVIDYMTYGGLYREVYLDIKEPVHIKDVFPRVTALQSGDGLTGDVTLECAVTLSQAENTRVVMELLDEQGELVRELTADGGRNELRGVKLWSPEQPARYTLRTKLWKDDRLVDEREEKIGLRTTEFRTDGFYLNGRKLKIRGLNRHQSYPYVGYAMPESIQRHDAHILKNELGLNAVRTSHYPQSHHFIDECDRLGLMVFTEIPGWQHIGGEEWKKQAVRNTRDMVEQYRNHPSIILWGVRINESMDSDAFYLETNAAAHELDDTRATGGVRCIMKSSLLEDVYTYNDFSHNGTNPGVVTKSTATSNMDKGYLITEYGGHMFPTKSFDTEGHRVEHMLRHARVENGYYGQDDIAGGFGWCMADYNTHRDFGSGDRVCYHGVLDMFRNHKLAAAVYAMQKECHDAEDTVLEVSSAMDIGEYPACQLPDMYILTNADLVKVYKNDQLVGEYGAMDTPFSDMPHGPVRVRDFVGDLLEKNEGFSHRKAEDVKKLLRAANDFGIANLPLSAKLLAGKCMLLYGMTMAEATNLYNKYMSNWGGTVRTYRFEAVVNGKVVKTVERRPVISAELVADVSHCTLTEKNGYDMAAVRIRVVSQDNAVLPFYQEPLKLRVEGPIEIVGGDCVTPRGGMCGTYVKTTGEAGEATLYIESAHLEPVTIRFTVKKEVI